MKELIYFLILIGSGIGWGLYDGYKIKHKKEPISKIAHEIRFLIRAWVVFTVSVWYVGGLVEWSWYALWYLFFSLFGGLLFDIVFTITINKYRGRKEWYISNRGWDKKMKDTFGAVNYFYYKFIVLGWFIIIYILTWF